MGNGKRGPSVHCMLRAIYQFVEGPQSVDLPIKSFFFFSEIPIKSISLLWFTCKSLPPRSSVIVPFIEEKKAERVEMRRRGRKSDIGSGLGIKIFLAK